MILCGFTTLGGGAFLLTSCGTASEQSGGEIADSDDAEIPTDNNQSSEEKLDDDVSADSANVTIRFLLRTSSSAYTVASTSTTNAATRAGEFTASLFDSTGTNIRWGTACTMYAGYSYTGQPQTVSGGSSVDYYAGDLSYLRYYNASSVRRYIRLVLYEGSGVAFCGLSTSTSNTSCQSEISGIAGSIYDEYFLYGSGSYTSSASTARSSCSTTLSGTYNIYMRSRYIISFNANGGSGAPTSKSILAGVSSTLPTTVPTRTDYTFLGWSTSSTASSATWKAGATYSSTYADEDDTLYAVWESNLPKLTIRFYSVHTDAPQLHIDPDSASSSGTVGGGIITGTQASTSDEYITSGQTSVVSITSIGMLQIGKPATMDIELDLGMADPTYYVNVDASSYPTSSNYDAVLGGKVVGTPEDPVVEPRSYTYTWTYYTSGMLVGGGYTEEYHDVTINVYARQQYYISFDGNGGSSPGSQYKAHGFSITLPTTATREGYTFAGWNTNENGTGTHYNAGATFSLNGDRTLYAEWTPESVTVKLQIMTSTNGTSYSNSVAGGTVVATYYYDNNGTTIRTSQVVDTATATQLQYAISAPTLKREITVTAQTTNEGFAFVGIATIERPPTGTSLQNSITPTGNTIIYAFFKVKSDNQLKYDSTDRYWYFEDGKYPQSYVGNSMNTTLSSSATVSGSSIRYFNGTSNVSIPIYKYGGNEYVKLRASSTMTIQTSVGRVTFTSRQYYFFEVEPIRWRVSEYGVSSTDYPDGWDAYGSYKTNFTVVSDRVLMASAVTNDTVREGWAFTSSELFSNVSISNTNSASAYADPKYDTSRSVTYYRYGNAGQQDKVTTVSRTENGLRVASVDEIEESFEDIRAYASDMVCFLLGIGSDEYANYWTRTLGTNLGNGKIITSAGLETSSWLDNMFGVRFAMTMSAGSRI